MYVSIALIVCSGGVTLRSRYLTSPRSSQNIVVGGYHLLTNKYVNEGTRGRVMSYLGA